MKLMLALIRNGSTESVAAGRYLGRKDESLCAGEAERLQKRSAEGRYPAVTLVYSGKSARSKETVEAIYPQSIWVSMDSLAPFHYGSLEGKTLRELTTIPELAEWLRSEQNRNCPGGDNPYGYGVRADRGFREIVQELCSKGIEDAAIVTHNLIICEIMKRYCLPKSAYREWGLPPGGGYIICYDTRLMEAKLMSGL